MGPKKFIFLSIAIAIFVTLLHPSIYPVNAQSKFVADFCNQRKTTEDRAFCLKVLKSKPVSETAKDYPTILKIALDLAIAHATRTRDFMGTLEKDNSTDVSLKPLLNVCISAYDDGIKELKGIVQELEDDPPMASYDAEMANDELSRCDTALTSIRVPNEAISIMHKIELDYSRLCVEIAEII